MFLNTLTLGEIKAHSEILSTHNVDDSQVFDYLRIVVLNNKHYEDECENTLYFLAHTTKEEVSNGWYENNGFDLRPYVNNIIAKNPNFTYVIEESMVDQIENKDAKYIVVKDINKTIDDLFLYTKSKCNPKVVAVTGSVGKTTCVGLIESVLKEEYNVLRIYSKRITPMLLKAYVINFLNEDVQIVVLENSIYYHDHVEVLSTMLKPDIAVLLNVSSSHLGVEMLDSVEAICKYKSLIFRHACFGLINQDDINKYSIKLDNGVLSVNNEEVLENKRLSIFPISNDSVKVEDDLFVFQNNVMAEPFIQSDLAKTQYQAANYIGVCFGLTKDQIERGMENYTGVENRLKTENAFGRKVIFDGDITTYERIGELANTSYKNKSLVLRKVGSAENVFRIADIKDHFSKFDKVYIFSDIEYLDELRYCPNVVVVDNHDFLEDIKGKVIYHYSGYYRVWEKFEDVNLKTYDRVRYPIMKASD